jgi:hypothetical protein
MSAVQSKEHQMIEKEETDLEFCTVSTIPPPPPSPSVL